MQQLPVQHLKEWLDQEDDPPLIIDVREPWEYNVCRIEPSKLIPMGQIPNHMDSFDPEQELVIICHHGIRSLQVCRFLEHHGFTKLYNVYGGIAAWAKEIDLHMNQY